MTASTRARRPQLAATRVVIAHQRSTIADADRIFLMDADRLMECGTYAELMARAGEGLRLQA